MRRLQPLYVYFNCISFAIRLSGHKVAIKLIDWLIDWSLPTDVISSLRDDVVAFLLRDAYIGYAYRVLAVERWLAGWLNVRHTPVLWLKGWRCHQTFFSAFCGFLIPHYGCKILTGRGDCHSLYDPAACRYVNTPSAYNTAANQLPRLLFLPLDDMASRRFLSISWAFW